MKRVTGIKTGSGCYKLVDDKIRAVIGQKKGQPSKFDVMQDQAGIDHRYSNGNYEYACRLPVITASAHPLAPISCNGAVSRHGCVCFAAPTPHGRCARVRVMEPDTYKFQHEIN